MSTSSFIILCLFIFCMVAVILSLATMGFMIHDRPFETTPLQRLGYMILALILTPILWVVGLALIIDYIFRQIIKESESKVS